MGQKKHQRCLQKIKFLFGLNKLTKVRPRETAMTVVNTYIPKVLNPSLPSFEMSANSETPFIKEKSTIGTAIILSSFMNILPKGSIQFKVKFVQPKKEEAMAHITPNSNPIIICQWIGIFLFIILI